MSQIKGIAAILGGLPILLIANFGGPPPGVAGAPGQGTCTQCHAGAVNSGGGSLTIEAGNYTPGISQSIRIQITHPSARARWGFQLTARLASNPSQQAGSFAAGPNQAVQTSGGVQFINHAPGVASQGTSHTFEVTWTAPASNVGDVIFYAAGNAANGNLANSGDSIYTASRTITPAAAGNRPVISANGVITAGDFGALDRITPGTWIEIYGQDLSTTTREWAAADFNGDRAPTSLDGVRVQIAGRDAFVRFISPRQVNVQVPDGIGTGTAIPVTVTNPNGTSAAAGVLGQQVSPGLLAPALWRVAGATQGQFKQYAFAQAGTEVVGVPAGTIPGVATRPARPGETIVLYGVGFGPVESLNAPGQAIPAGVIARGLSRLVANPVFRFGPTQAELSYAGLAPNFVGLYQFNVIVPAGLASQEYQLIVNVGDQQIGYAIDVRR